MAIELLDEYEQGEQVRKWLRQNGSSLITGIALGLACIYGWNRWQNHGSVHREEAATQYTSFTEALGAKDDKKIDALSKAFESKYADTGYAVLVALRNAQYLQSTGKLNEAIALLQNESGKIKEPAMAELIVLRQGRLLLISGKPEAALKRVEAIRDSRFPAVLDELRGDIQMARGQRDGARKSYQQALTNLDEAAPTRRLLELKLIDAGGQPPAQPEA